MSPRKKTPPDPAGGRYPQMQIAAEIETARARLRISAKRAADDIGVRRTVWYKKRDTNGSSFSLEDISVLAEAWDAPDHWPFRRPTEAEWSLWKEKARSRGQTR